MMLVQSVPSLGICKILTDQYSEFPNEHDGDL